MSNRFSFGDKSKKKKQPFLRFEDAREAEKDGWRAAGIHDSRNTGPAEWMEAEEKPRFLADQESRKKFNKRLNEFGGFALAAFFAAMFFSPSGSPNYDVSDAAKRALEDRVSTALSAGAVLAASDDTVQPVDYTIRHQSQDESTRIWVWDYAAEDGDYVQVLVNGTSLTEPFMIKHKPRAFTVPATGDVQIRGIRDGGGGITYAVHFELNGTTYLNGAPPGEDNTYTLIRE
ncbi:MAG TPA: hypothetical protein VIL22_09110 [Paenibacillaceae bacterium]